jgi:hypothetical protein
VLTFCSPTAVWASSSTAPTLFAWVHNECRPDLRAPARTDHTVQDLRRTHGTRRTVPGARLATTCRHVHYGIGGAESQRSLDRSAHPRTAALMRRAASSQNSSSSSAPTMNRPSSLEATPLVPYPQHGSKTNSPSRVEATSARLTRRKGFWVGWDPWRFSSFGTGSVRVSV